MFFLNRVYFYSKYIKQVLISSVLVFLFSYSSVGIQSAKQADADIAYKAALEKAEDAIAIYKDAYQTAAAAAKEFDRTREAYAIALREAKIAYISAHKLYKKASFVAKRANPLPDL